MESKINVMGIDIDHISYQTLRRATLEYLRNDRMDSYIFLSTRLIEEAAKDPLLAESMSQADLLLPGDERIYGVQEKPLIKKNMVMGYTSLLELAGKTEHIYTVYLLAEQKRILDKIIKYIEHNFPKIKIIGSYNQEENWTDEQLVNSINSVNPDILMNTIPLPTEVFWVATYGQQISAKLYIGLGAIFDVMVSELKEPPVFIRKLHLHTLYHKIRGYGKHKSLRMCIFRRKVEQYNTKKGDNENGTTS